ncbi:MAG: hypothetical protein HPY50_08560 [Firmicutes bacterium]|nr:hypothetical protein [Bacillota bacterium]
MLVENALIAKSGILSHRSKCLLCQKDFEWCAPVDKAAKDVVGRGTGAEASIEGALIVCGGDRWADLSVSVECPHCGIRNVFKGIKWKVD